MADSRKNIGVLHVLGSLNRGGTETWIVELLRALKEYPQIRSEILVQSDAGPEGYGEVVKEMGIPVYVIPRNLAWPVTLFRFLRKQPRYDVVHSHRNEFSAAVLSLARIAGVRTRIAHSHNDMTRNETMLHRCYRLACRSILKAVSTKRVGVSDAARESLFGDDEKADVIYCGLDLSRYAYSDERRKRIREEFRIPEDAILIGHVGGFRSQKNHGFLLEVFEEVQSRVNGRARMILVGDGHLRRDVEMLAEEKGLAQEIIFAGVRPDVHEILSGMDFFLFPSLYEGLGLVLVEAQAAGLPLVASDSIPSIAFQTGDLSQTLSLQRPASEWADLIVQMIERHSGTHRGSVPAALEIFNIRASRDSMMQIYRGN